jgi:Na+/H+-dicarboxylate symporter
MGQNLANGKKKLSLATSMAIALVCGIGAGLILMFIRESLVSSGSADTWATINRILFQDITMEGAENAIGIFYIGGQLFIRSLQLIIIPMVFTSITLAIGAISDTKALGRIAFKTIGFFLICSAIALVLAVIVGISIFNAGLFKTTIEGITDVAQGTTGANPLNVILNIIPPNIATAFSTNTAVLSIVFLAIALGLSMNFVGEEKSKTIKHFVSELNAMVVVFLNYVVTKFGPFAIFLLLTRTFATYGINHLKPALVYVLITFILLLVFLFICYPLIGFIFTKLNPMKFAKKILKVAIFGFSTSSSAATLPLNTETTVNEMGVDEKIASFVLPLGMTVNMNGTAIMQVIATLFVAGCGGYDVSPIQLIAIALLALIASAGTPAAPGAGAIVLFTILSGVGFTNEGALMAYTLILAINRPIEMLCTSLNVVGDSLTSIFVGKSEKLIDEGIYNS